MNNTFHVSDGVVTWNIDSNGTTTMTATYTTNTTGAFALLSIHRPYKSIEYTIIGGGGGGGSGTGGIQSSNFGGGAGGGGGGGRFIDGSFNNTSIPIMFTGIVAGSGGDGGNGGDGVDGFSSYFTYNYEDISEKTSPEGLQKIGGRGGREAPTGNTYPDGGAGSKGGTNISQTLREMLDIMELAVVVVMVVVIILVKKVEVPISIT